MDICTKVHPSSWKRLPTAVEVFYFVFFKMGKMLKATKASINNGSIFFFNCDFYTVGKQLGQRRQGVCVCVLVFSNCHENILKCKAKEESTVVPFEADQILFLWKESLRHMTVVGWAGRVLSLISC